MHVSLTELSIYLDRADWQLSVQEYSGNSYQCQMPNKVARAYIYILPPSSTYSLTPQHLTRYFQSLDELSATHEA